MKGSILAASAALVASAAASSHKNHAGFHFRRNPAADVCTVYTTVYVYPSEIPAVPVASSPAAYPTSVETPVVVVPTSVETPVVVVPTSVETPVVEYPVQTPVESKPEAESSTSCTESTTPVASAPTSEAPTQDTPAIEYPTVSVPAEAPVSSKPAVYSSALPANTPATSAYTTVQPKPVSSSSKAVVKPTTSASSTSSTPTGSYSSGGRIVVNGDKWAMTYTPYTEEGDCRTAAQVKTDIANIASMGFTTIRSYSTDCGVFENVVPECQKHGLKVIYGIFMEGGGSAGKGPFSDYANEQLQAIIKNSPKDSIAMIIVGNEALFNNYCTAGELASYITYVREQLASAGFPSDIAITTTEPVGTWEEKGAALCDVIDVFAVQVHPYFTSSVTAEKAGSFAKQQLAQAAKVCPDAAAKGQYITEIGWPKSGNTNGVAVPGVAEQKVALKSIMKEVGAEACLFSYQDDYWKEPGAYNVEQSFGCSEAFSS